MITPERWACFFALDRRLIRLLIDGHSFDLSTQEATALQHGLAVAVQRSIDYADRVPDTQPAPPVTPEPPTTPGTQEARRRSSDKLQAVRPGGLAERVEAILEGGKEPQQK